MCYDTKLVVRVAGRELWKKMPDKDAIELQISILLIFREVLGMPSLGADDDFFACGGTSFQAVEIAAEISEQCRLEVSPTNILLYPNVADLVKELTRALPKTLGP